MPPKCPFGRLSDRKTQQTRGTREQCSVAQLTVLLHTPRARLMNLHYGADAVRTATRQRGTHFQHRARPSTAHHASTHHAPIVIQSHRARVTAQVTAAAHYRCSPPPTAGHPSMLLTSSPPTPLLTARRLFGGDGGVPTGGELIKVRRSGSGHAAERVLGGGGGGGGGTCALCSSVEEAGAGAPCVC